jgi:hypothetical protein
MDMQMQPGSLVKNICLIFIDVLIKIYMLYRGDPPLYSCSAIIGKEMGWGERYTHLKKSYADFFRSF